MDSEFDLVKKVFRYTLKDKPLNYDSFKCLYVDMIKSITNKDIIINTPRRVNNKKINYYTLNMDYINTHMTLNKFYNHDMTGYDTDFNILLHKHLNTNDQFDQ